MDGAEQVGIDRAPDHNGEFQDGIAMSQTTIRHGRRMSTAYCYLHPAKNWQNLTVQTHALTEKLLTEEMRCTGVRYAVKGEMHEARAAREVLVNYSNSLALGRRNAFRASE